MLGIGTDIVKISRIRDTMARSGRIFLDRVFTEREQKSSRLHQDAAVYYAERFAAKEAVFKTFFTQWEGDMSFLDIEIENGCSGAPTVVLHGRFLELLKEKSGKGILLSLSWEEDTTLAFAVMY
ncbi:MAG: holo-[acyl-carrier-protein] synthase [Bacillota bacterium]|jgi:holo-[acyl-carrier protein] synthase|nr:holo-[acyl-carrier-protein] synthase [Bacillota bacterium]